MEEGILILDMPLRWQFTDGAHEFRWTDLPLEQCEWLQQHVGQTVDFTVSTNTGPKQFRGYRISELVHSGAHGPVVRMRAHRDGGRCA